MAAKEGKSQGIETLDDMDKRKEELRIDRKRQFEDGIGQKRPPQQHRDACSPPAAQRESEHKGRNDSANCKRADAEDHLEAPEPGDLIKKSDRSRYEKHQEDGHAICQFVGLARSTVQTKSGSGELAVEI